MTLQLIALVLLAATAGPAFAQNNNQVIVPQVERRDVRRPSYPSNDISLTLYGGVYSAQNFGSSGTGGLRLGYHITEDVFVEAAWGSTTVSDEAFRQVLPGGVFVDRKQRLTHYNVSAGWNLLTGEAFFGRSTAKATQGYVVLGIGSTDFAGQKQQTINFGFGLRLLLSDRFAVQADVRDHVFDNDILGKRQRTHNPEVTAGLSIFF